MYGVLWCFLGAVDASSTCFSSSSRAGLVKLHTFTCVSGYIGRTFVLVSPSAVSHLADMRNVDARPCGTMCIRVIVCHGPQARRLYHAGQVPRSRRAVCQDRNSTHANTVEKHMPMWRLGGVSASPRHGESFFSSSMRSAVHVQEVAQLTTASTLALGRLSSTVDHEVSASSTTGHQGVQHRVVGTPH